MAYYVNVLYPRADGSTFDMDYYLTTHMPLIDKHWGKYGIEGWEVLELEAGIYSIQTIIRWTDAESYQKASAPDNEDAQAIRRDVPNFSSERPIVVHGGRKAERK